MLMMLKCMNENSIHVLNLVKYIWKNSWICKGKERENRKERNELQERKITEKGENETPCNKMNDCSI